MNDDPSEALIRVTDYYTGQHLERTGAGWRKIHCVYHHDTRQSASVNLDNGIYKCFGCEVQGDALNIIRIKEGVDYASSKRRYKEIAGSDYSGVSESFDGFPRCRVFNSKRDYERGSGLFPDWMDKQ